MKRTRRIVGWIVAAASASAPAALHACPICFGIDDGPTASGVRAAVLVLLGVTTAVLTGFAIFIARFARRALAGQAAEGRPES